MEKEFLVKFESSTKIVSVFEGSSVIGCIKEVFSIVGNENLKLQKYDSNWEDYIDIPEEELQELPTRSKLKCVRKMMGDSDSISSVASSSLTETYNKGNGESNWPEEFSMSQEKFSRMLKQQLSDEKYLSWSCKHELLGIIVDDIFKYTYYPNLMEITCVAKCIIQAYPYLAEKIGSGYDGWVQCLRDKLKNVRRNMNVPVVKWRKRTSADNVQSRANKRLKYSPKGKNWGPEFPKGEDAASCKVHIEKMKNIMSDPHRDNELLMELMDKTYPYRRSYVNECPPISSIMEEYPALKLKSVFLSEMCKLVSKDCQKVFEGNCARSASSLIEIAKTKKEAVIKTIINTMNTTIDDIIDIQPKDISSTECVASLQLLPHLLGDQSNMFVCIFSADASLSEIKDKGPRTPFTAVVGSPYEPTTIYLITEGQILLTFTSLLEAIFYTVCAFYIFNIQFPKQAFNTWTFVEAVLLELNVKVPKRVLTLRGKLQI